VSEHKLFLSSGIVEADEYLLRLKQKGISDATFILKPRLIKNRSAKGSLTFLKNRKLSANLSVV